MSSYAILWRGDVLPSVGVLQILLRRAGSSVAVHGTFDEETESEVIAFQKERKLRPDGIVGPVTWKRLRCNLELSVVDVIDVFDPMMWKKKRPMLLRQGSTPIEMGGMENAIDDLVGLLVATQRDIFTLRLIGHGCPGVMALSMGQGYYMGYDEQHKWGAQRYPHQTTALHPYNFEVNENGHLRQPLLPLSTLFGPYGNLELHGCHVANGEIGQSFVAKMAEIVKVPVTAGSDSQRSAVHFDGPTFTACPGGETLRSWCGNLPRLPAMSVP